MKNGVKFTCMLTLLGAFLSAPAVAFAVEVPIEDITQQASSSANAGGDSMATTDQRVNILEKQMRNLTQMDLLNQINTLQQEVQRLRGKLDVQKHDLQQLTEQLRTQYQDLDQRLKQSKPDAGVQALGTADTSANKVTHAKVIPTEVLSDSSLEEQKEYQAAYGYLRDRDYMHAKTTLQNFLSKYPDGSYAANAHYWLGEIYLIQGQPDPAAAEFNIVISKYPTNTKVPDAMLKLGFAYCDKGDWTKAREQLSAVKKKYAGTTTAQLALTRLQQLKQQGK
jgi:tol-pal system protein YbgF